MQNWSEISSKLESTEFCGFSEDWHDIVNLNRSGFHTFGLIYMGLSLNENEMDILREVSV